MEIFNEVILMFVFYTFLCFTPWLAEIEMKQSVGYATCGLVAFHFLFNLFIMLSGSIKGSIRNCRLKKARKGLKK